MEKQESASYLLYSQGVVSVSSFAQKIDISIEESAQVLSSLINNNGIFGVYTEYTCGAVKLSRHPKVLDKSKLFMIMTRDKENNCFVIEHESRLEALQRYGMVHFPSNVGVMIQDERKIFGKYKASQEITENVSQEFKGILTNGLNNHHHKSVMFTPVKDEPLEKPKIHSTPHPVKLKQALKNQDIFSKSYYVTEESTETRGPMDNLVKRKLVDVEKNPKKRIKTQTKLFIINESKKYLQSAMDVQKALKPAKKIVKRDFELTEDTDTDLKRGAQSTMMSFIIKK